MSAPDEKRDHGGGLDAAMARYGGSRDQWLDLSTGINPVPYPVGDIPADAWQRLPNEGAMDALLHAARRFWNVPEEAAILAAPGASALIARLPDVMSGEVSIAQPTYNEWAAAFGDRAVTKFNTPLRVFVHPNNPTGSLMNGDPTRSDCTTIYDESFADDDLSVSHVRNTHSPKVVVVKSFGKFWGLAGLRLGFLIGQPRLIRRMNHALGPWPVSGPALTIATRALNDTAWADATRARLSRDAARLDALILPKGAELVGGTGLFRTYALPETAPQMHERLAQAQILTRIFPYSEAWIRFGLPGSEADWAKLEAAL
ncbi:threonine-phosphate decarboxylase [Gymnodinialimonas hymeniacidonis]|uniref:threonine-phosphate decarboxylase n=1 Tax=Gymnodinialimonas hymeniacidonis TaxID=3126508 RepID=UPI0034C6CE06